MKFGIFYEHQLPKPWNEGDEHKLFKDALDQIELADRVGFDCVWEVEHHFLEEYSHSSAPEVFLAAASQRTKRIRLGHGIVALPHQFNHPFRVAERIANLDLVSDGRVEFGTGETSSEAELLAFHVERETKREQRSEALDAVTRMFVETPFAGWDGSFSRYVAAQTGGPLGATMMQRGHQSLRGAIGTMRSRRRSSNGCPGDRARDRAARARSAGAGGLQLPRCAEGVSSAAGSRKRSRA